jgi:glucose-6-phosphate isomerase
MADQVLQPLSLVLGWTAGELTPSTSVVRRHLSDMQGMYADADAEQHILTTEDPLIYEVRRYDMPNEPGQLMVSTTVLYPGRVGDEYYMTKGHAHAKPEVGEIYLGLRGHGKVLMQADRRFSHLDMASGTVAFIPPHCAHRTVNTGDDPFVFLAVCRADAGHDYAAVERDGFLHRVVRRHGLPALDPPLQNACLPDDT